MKKTFTLILIFFSSLFLFVPNEMRAQSEAEGKKKAIYFYQEACQHCQNVERYFQENKIYDKYDIKKVEITGAYNLDYFNEFFAAFNVSPEKRGWPAIFFGHTFLVGDRPIIQKFVSEIDADTAQDFPTIPDIKAYMAGQLSERENLTPYKLPWFFLIGAALTDAVSPCSLAVFIILAGIIIFGRPNNRREAFLFGLLFSLSVLAVYLGLGISMYNVDDVFRLARGFNLLLGVTALAISAAIILPVLGKNKSPHLKLETAAGFLAGSGKVWQGLKKVLQRTNFGLVAILVGIFSSVFLLPCAVRPYGIITESLTREENIFLSLWPLGLYNLIFILPLIVLTGGGYYLMHIKRLETFRIKHDKILRLVWGAVMLFTGVYFMHNWL